MLSALVGTWVRTQAQRIGLILARTNLSPNWFTVFGLMINIFVAAVIASGNLILGGFLALLAGGFDILDGAVARATGQITRFGGFFDSTLDRYSEAVVYFGVLIYFQRFNPDSTAVLLIFATVVGSLMVSYARARAEVVNVASESGIFTRTERVVVLSIFLFAQLPLWSLWALAILTNFTTAQRIYNVWRVTRASDQP